MKNSWKTTLIGILTGGAMVGLDLYSKGETDSKTIIVSVAFAILGILAKDFNVKTPTNENKK